MFEQSMLKRANGGRRFLSTCLGVTGEALVVTGVVIAPLVWPQVLERPKGWIAVYTPTVPRPLGNAELKKTHVEPTRVHRATPHGFLLPTSVPKRIDTTPDEPVAEAPNMGGVVGGANIGSPDGVRGGIDLTSLIATARPAPAYHPPEPAAAPTRTAPRSIPRIAVGGTVQEAKLLVAVKPIYPPLARAARVSGTVELEAVIGRDGRLAELKVRKGHALLIQAAVDAVRQWVYKPTFLNGDPVEVSTMITVNFILGQ